MKHIIILNRIAGDVGNADNLNTEECNSILYEYNYVDQVTQSLIYVYSCKIFISLLPPVLRTQ